MVVHPFFVDTFQPPCSGQLDHDFARRGQAQVQFNDSRWSQAHAIATDASGRLLIAAQVGTDQGMRFGLARMLVDGSADMDFGVQGSVIGAFEDDGEANGCTLNVLPDGRILLGGLHYSCAERSLPALALFDADGQLDPAFGQGGRQVVRLPGDLSCGLRDQWLPTGLPGAEACDVQVQADGRILLIANRHYTFADHWGVLICLHATGALDTTFNGRGFVIVRHLQLNTWLSSVLLQADGRIVVAGSTDFPLHGLVARYEPDGQLDESFADHGFLCFNAQGQGALVSRVIQQSDGRLQCLGSSRDPVQGLSLMLGPQGSPCGQVCLTPIGGTSGYWTAALTQADGRVLTVGSTLGGVEADFVVARHHPQGGLDASFGQGAGWVRTRLGHSVDIATSLAQQADGKIVVAGSSLMGSSHAVVVRYLG